MERDFFWERPKKILINPYPLPSSLHTFWLIILPLLSAEMPILGAWLKLNYKGGCNGDQSEEFGAIDAGIFGVVAITGPRR